MKKIFFFLLAIIPAVSISQIPEPRANTYVNDLAGVLTPHEEQLINYQARRLEDSTTVQIALVLVNDLPEGIEVEDYALQIGRQWHVGKGNNGLVYVAVLNSRKQRLEVANNLQGTITDIDARRLTDIVKPYFRKKDYGAGVEAMVKAIYEKVKPEATEQVSNVKNINDSGGHKTDMSVLFITVSLLLTWFSVWYFADRREKKVHKKKAKFKADPDEDLIKLASRLKTPVRGSGGYSTPAGGSVSSYVPDVPTNKPSDDSDDDDNYKRNMNSNDSSTGFGNWGGSGYSGFSGGGANNDW